MIPTLLSDGWILAALVCVVAAGALVLVAFRLTARPQRVEDERTWTIAIDPASYDPLAWVGDWPAPPEVSYGNH